ncbi:MAG: hypothetical protein GC205_02800 [Bacteroidetes bacterium]|nr:hypothetical protein [Bacteroidota bacterium]
MLTEDGELCAMIIQRLNQDSSWFLHWNNLRLIVDPWLVGSEVDGAPWLNEQWHVTDPVPPEQVPEADAILIAQSYNDHCHIPTLRSLPATLPILATRKAYNRLKRCFPDRKLLLIPDQGTPLNFRGFVFQAFRPAKRLDPVYFGVMVRPANAPCLFYAPHGFDLKAEEVAQLRETGVHALVTTFTDFRLPGIMGGHVNPGMEQVQALVRSLQPSHLLNTHDEAKQMKGLVARLAKVHYADLAAVQMDPALPFRPMPGYEPVHLPL